MADDKTTISDKARITEIIHSDIEEYVKDYEFRGDGGDYQPTENERLLIEDAMRGYLDDMDEKITKHFKDRSAEAGSIIKAFADWSNKYPKGVIYPMSCKVIMDGELEAIETAAKQYEVNSRKAKKV